MLERARALAEVLILDQNFSAIAVNELMGTDADQSGRVIKLSSSPGSVRQKPALSFPRPSKTQLKFDPFMRSWRRSVLPRRHSSASGPSQG